MGGDAMRLYKLFSALATATILSLHAHAAVWYVDKDNTGPEDGTSWATAFQAVQTAATIQRTATVREGIDVFDAAGWPRLRAQTACDIIQHQCWH